jgi:uroporphyrinogen decarboxylase
MVDSDGNDWELLPIFLEAGVNLFTPLEIAAGMEPLAIRDRHPTLALLGGIDKRVLRDGREAIRREIDRKVPALLARGGYFPSLDHHVPADVSFEGFSVYLEELRAVTE